LPFERARISAAVFDPEHGLADAAINPIKTRDRLT
jgi:hypothetical protein